MKFRFLSKWSIILTIFINLHFIQGSSDNSRSKPTLQTKYLQQDLDFEDEVKNASEQNHSLDDYEDTHNVMKKHISSQNIENKSDKSSHNFHKHSGGIVKRSADLELAQFELEKVEKNVENEIINLKKRYNNNRRINYKRGIKNNHVNPSSPRLTKIRVETYEIGDELVGDHLNSNERKEQSSLSSMPKSPEDIANKKSANMIKQSVEKSSSQHISDEKKNENKMNIENVIQDKIDTIKNKVARLIAKEQKHNKIRRNNARYDKLYRTKLSKRNKSFKSLLNTEFNMEQKSINKKSASSSDKNKLDKLHTKNITHDGTKKLTKSIRKPAKTVLTLKKVSSADDPQLQLILDKSKGSDTRIARRLRYPPTDSEQLRRLSRRLRKPPGAESALPKKLQVNQKSRRAINAQNITNTETSNFLFNDISNRRKPAMSSNQVKQLSLSKKQVERTLEHKHERRKTNHLLTNNDKFGQRTERAVNTPLGQPNFDSMANVLDNMAHSHDINSQLVSEYSNTFGGFPSDSDDTSLMRYKRVKRA